MRWLAGILVLLITLIAGAFLYLKEMPHILYANWVEGKSFDRFYRINNYRPLLLESSTLETIAPYQEDYVQLWKEFPLRNSLVPLPTRHPLFQTVPIIELKNAKSLPQLGMIFQDPTGREVSRIYPLPNKLSLDYSQGQELFKLPFVRNRILSKKPEDIWNDIFSYKIEKKEKSIDEMIYDLYLLHIRSVFLPQDTLRYGLIKEGKQALIELSSADKDYTVELVMTLLGGSIYSYIIKTEKNRKGSQQLRAKFLESISFSPVDEAMSKLLYTEFKALNYARQVDQEGMLYLFSAWSQNTENVELLKEMIYYLERGQNTKKQLRALYTYSFKKYGKTYTTRKDMDEQDNPEIVLQRNIEVEEKERRAAAEAAQLKTPEPPELTPDEKMNLYLKRAKEDKRKESDEMTVH